MSYDSSYEPPVYDFSAEYNRESEFMKTLKELFKIEEYKPELNANPKNK